MKFSSSFAIGELGFDKLPVKEIDAKVRAAMTEVNKVKGANIVSLVKDRWALSYEPAKAVEALKASVAASVLISTPAAGLAVVTLGLVSVWASSRQFQRSQSTHA